MQHLPVPPLEHTAKTYLRAVRPLVDDDDAFARTTSLVADFVASDGPACQAELEAFAAQENGAGRSWLSEAWLAGYLTVRTPVALTTSATLRMRLGDRDAHPAGRDGGLDWAADAVYRLASVHLAYLRGELPAETTPRGEPVCATQREVLAGGLRHPRADGVDEMRPGDPSPVAREIGVLVEDRYVAAPISDDAGRPLSRAQVRALLAAALREAPSAELVEPGFTIVSSLGSEVAAPLLAELLTDPGNAATYERLTQALFLVRLDEGGDAPVEQLRRGAFEPGQAWAYKTFTYQLGLADGFAATHMEHTAIDGGTLKAVVEAAQQVPDGAIDPIDPGAGSPRVEPLSWRLTAQQRDRLAREAARYAQAAADHRLEVVRVDTPRTDHLSFRVSDDAVQQWLFLYAQLATYGRIRSTYESVDMRHMQAGRTECLRAITPEAVALVSALLPGSASSGSAGETDKAALVDAALAAHKSWVQAAKTGHGIDRHLLGLRLAADRLGLRPALFDDPALSALGTEFLSTTSLGDQSQISWVAFAPTSPGGIGIYYSLVPGGYEWLLSHRAGDTESYDAFVENLRAGATAMLELFAAL